jgi:hypothetical protein
MKEQKPKYLPSRGSNLLSNKEQMSILLCHILGNTWDCLFFFLIFIFLFYHFYIYLHVDAFLHLLTCGTSLPTPTSGIVLLFKGVDSLVVVKCYIIGDLICISLVTNEVEHLFMFVWPFVFHLLGIFYSYPMAIFNRTMFF